MVDYYEVLAVAVDATQDDIKKAYKKRAMEWHPDRPTGSADKFKQLVDAYNILNDVEARKTYDRRRNNNPSTFASKFSQVASAASTTAKKVMNDFVDDGLFDTLDKFLGRKREPNSIEIEIKVTLEELYEGADKQVFFKRSENCDKCEGRGAEKKEDIQVCIDCYGFGHTVSNLASIFSKEDCKKCKGSGKIIHKKCSVCKGRGERKYDREFTFPIPKDLNLGAEKDRLVLPGEGEFGGDLLLQVSLKPHKYYTVSWPDLSVEIPIQFYQAILGDYLEIDTLRGAALFKIDAGTEHGEQVILKGYGLRKTDAAGVTKYGDLTVKVELAIPKRISKEQRKVLEDFRDLERNKTKNKSSTDS